MTTVDAPTSQLDKAEREHLEDIVARMRKRAEQDVRFQVEQEYGLKTPEDAPAHLGPDAMERRQQLVDAVEREQAGGKSWAKALRLYVKGVGYTLANRLTALRCMEVRGFQGRAVTRFRDDGRTPASDPLVDDEYLTREEAVWEAFERACQAMADEIEILFDLDSPYSLAQPEVETFEDLCRMLDEVPDAVWRADDVLGWVYEYYNKPDLERIDDRRDLQLEEVATANQFYTPHWVVRMLTDNSLGKLFLESEGTLRGTMEAQQRRFSFEERKQRSAIEAGSIEELCTYLMGAEEKGEATNFEDPSEIRVLDPACGSGHFLLYALDVLERIWWTMRPDVPREEVPAKILRHNLFGVDLDLRACQLAAFNLYLKARTRAEARGADRFQLPALGIVCADAHVADLDRTSAVFDEVAADDESLRKVLGNILEAFETVEGLGGLLDVRGTLSTLVEEDALPLFSGDDDDLSTVLAALHSEIQKHMNGGSFQARDLRSFLRLLVVLSQEYDVTLMNPPYGSRGRMPQSVKKYVEGHYSYGPEYYVAFFEACERLTKSQGRVGMLVPWSFMFNDSFKAFRDDFVGEEGGFDFFAEFGYGILDSATVGTVGTVVRKGLSGKQTGDFIRLNDVGQKEKEEVFLRASFDEAFDDEVQRVYSLELSKLAVISDSPISYWVPHELRSLYQSETVLDAENANLDKKSLGVVKQGIATGKNSRFLRHFWEAGRTEWIPFAKGGEETWCIPPITRVVLWENGGEEISRYEGSRFQNTQFLFNEAVTYALAKRRGRRFGYLNRESVFGMKGGVIIPKCSPWPLLAYLNSRLVTYLMLAQTSERMWQIGMVSKLPWDDALAGNQELGKKMKEVAGLLLLRRQSVSSSPYYSGPLLLRMAGKQASLPWHDHSHRTLMDEVPAPNWLSEDQDSDASLKTLATRAEETRQRIDVQLHEKAREIDALLFDHFDIWQDQQELILREIAYRTIEDPRERPSYDPDAVTEPPEDFPELVKRMILHLAFEVVQDDDDGIVLLGRESDEEEATLLNRLEDKFTEVFGAERAEERLAEADQVLGRRAPQDEPYPNLRRWLEKKLFAFHCSEFENTPILWKLTSGRLTSGASEGFACLVDYHRLGPGLFDRIQTRYLEKRKAALRQKREAARQRASDDSLNADARAKAEDEQERCTDALRQVDALEDAFSDLSRTQPRDWTDENRQRARDLAPTVRRFRERTEERLATLDRLHEAMPAEAFEDRFSPKFMEKVEGKRDEWIDALRDLEAACEAYARPAVEPVEAHLYDLFPYYIDKLAGSTWYSAAGILFLNYYFKKGKTLAENVEEGDELSEPERLIVELARETDRDVELGREIEDACQKLKKRIPSDWKTRALQEVRAQGYQPVKKHGVAINITPLAEAKIVPELVNDKVL